MTSKITTCVWYDGTAEEAANFYVNELGLPDSRINKVSRAPSDNPGTKEGDVLVVDFTLAGMAFIGLNGGPQFPHSEAVSFQIETVDQVETDHLWNTIVDNGGAESQCGWCKDKWGVNWQITPRILTELTSGDDPERARRGFAAMMTMKKIDIATIEAAADGRIDV